MNFHQLATYALTTVGVLLVSSVILLCIWLLVIYIRDRFQSKHAILRNYPIIGHFRYFFEHLGTFFRQYFFAMDREELPFNRAQRTWVYRAAKNLDNTSAYGSTRPIRGEGTFIFVNGPFPTLSEDSCDPQSLVIGPQCKHPHKAESFFNVSGMSYGAISKPAVKALSHGCKKAGCWLNTGEGGLSPYHLEGGCDLVAQIGTAKYGYRTLDGQLSDEKLKKAAEYPQVKMFEIKLSQGAKPGKGGLLPAAKVTQEIAEVRGIREGEDSVSPNRFPEISSSTELLTMIHHVREVTGKPVGIKFVLGSSDWLIRLFEEIHQEGIESAPDFITVDSADGGTGAAPMPLMDYMGLHIEESLPLVIDLLHIFNLKDRIKVIASGKMITPSMVAWALSVGADFVVSARGFMFALGCIQAMQCNKNTCPTGVTTHDKRLQQGLVPEEKAERVCHYVKNMHKEVGMIAHSCGIQEPRDLKRHHCRIVQDNGQSIALSELHPIPKARR